MSGSVLRGAAARAAAAAVTFALLAVTSEAWAVDPLEWSPDVAVELAGLTVQTDAVVADVLFGSVKPVDVGLLPAATRVSAYHVLEDGDQLLVFDTTVSLPGKVVAGPRDVVRYDGTRYQVVFDGAARGIPAGARIDALAMIEAGPLSQLLLSFDVTIPLDGVTADDEDLVSFRGPSFPPQLFFDGSAERVPSALDLDAADVRRASGVRSLSFDGSGRVGGIDFDDEDVLNFDPASDQWVLAYDGSARDAAWAPADLAALWGAASDADADAVSDIADNCLDADNRDQIDSDLDGYGDRCDPDYNNDGAVGIPDFAVFRPQFGRTDAEPGFDPAVDHNGDGAVGIPDFNVLRSYFGQAPGPSGLVCAGKEPCVAP